VTPKAPQNPHLRRQPPPEPSRSATVIAHQPLVKPAHQGPAVSTPSTPAVQCFRWNRSGATGWKGQLDRVHFQHSPTPEIARRRRRPDPISLLDRPPFSLNGIQSSRHSPPFPLNQTLFLPSPQSLTRSAPSLHSSALYSGLGSACHSINNSSPPRQATQDSRFFLTHREFSCVRTNRSHS
jgi:hypothetical protein